MSRGVVAGGVLLAFVTSAAAGQGTSLRRAWCASDYSQKRIYLSGIFASAASAGDLANLFGSHLQKRYGFKPTAPTNPAVCFELASAQAASENKQLTEARFKNGGKQLVETGWTPTTAEVSKLPAVPPPPKPGSLPGSTPVTPRYAWCHSLAEGTRYFSASFKGTDAITVATWEIAFSTYLQKKYKYGEAGARCEVSGIADSAKARLSAEVARVKAVPTVRVVETGWRYKP
jgi:hypothetical protein